MCGAQVEMCVFFWIYRQSELVWPLCAHCCFNWLARAWRWLDSCRVLELHVVLIFTHWIDDLLFSSSSCFVLCYVFFSNWMDHISICGIWNTKTGLDVGSGGDGDDVDRDGIPYAHCWRECLFHFSVGENSTSKNKFRKYTFFVG